MWYGSPQSLLASPRTALGPLLPGTQPDPRLVSFNRFAPVGALLTYDDGELRLDVARKVADGWTVLPAAAYCHRLLDRLVAAGVDLADYLPGAPGAVAPGVRSWARGDATRRAQFRILLDRCQQLNLTPGVEYRVVRCPAHGLELTRWRARAGCGLSLLGPTGSATAP